MQNLVIREEEATRGRGDSSLSGLAVYDMADDEVEVEDTLMTEDGEDWTNFVEGRETSER